MYPNPNFQNEMGINAYESFLKNRIQLILEKISNIFSKIKESPKKQNKNIVFEIKQISKTILK